MCWYKLSTTNDYKHPAWFCYCAFGLFIVLLVLLIVCFIVGCIACFVDCVVLFPLNACCSRAIIVVFRAALVSSFVLLMWFVLVC